jgi:serine phosphatase RsbU (regulator of sigma subunit)
MKPQAQALRVLVTFFKIATFVFSALTLSISGNSQGITWFMWRDLPILAWTLVALSLLMTGGWWYTARRLRSMDSESQFDKFNQRKIPSSAAGQAYNIWRGMRPAHRFLLAVAVFLIFSTIGPLSVLMKGGLQPASVLRILLVTISSGGISASIILFGHKRVILILAIVFFASGNIFTGQIEEWLTGRPGLRIESETAPVVLSPEQRLEMSRQREILGAFAILLLGGGYVMFIVLLNKEGSERLRLETEVSIARGIQDSLLPSETLETAWCEIAGRTVPTSEVGGDYFDTFRISDHEIGVAIADVSGHGVGAGILAAMTKSGLRSQLKHDPGPVKVLENLNAVLCDITQKNVFVTLAYILLNDREKRARVATAGHPPVLHWTSPDSMVHELRTPNPGLGIQRKYSFSELVVPYAAGDTFLLYTDGITEAVNSHGEQFGSEKVLTALSANRVAGAEDLCKSVITAVWNFRGSSELADDVTVLCVKLKKSL